MYERLIKSCFEQIEEPTGRTKHFSFICDGAKVISYGVNNMRKTDAEAYRRGFSFGFIHSEIMAIKRFPYRPDLLRKYTLINIRVNTRKRVLMSRPCRLCQNVIIAFDFKKILYTNERGLFEELVY